MMRITFGKKSLAKTSLFLISLSVLLIFLIKFVVPILAAILNEITINFEEGGNSSQYFYLRDGSDDIDLDKYNWKWSPISTSGYLSNHALLLNLSVFDTDKIVYSRTISQSILNFTSGFFELSFLYKTPFNGSLIAIYFEVLYAADGTGDVTKSVSLFGDGARSVDLNVTTRDVSDGWKNVTIRNLQALSSTRKFRIAFVNSVESIESQYLSIDNIKLSSVIT